MQALLSAVRKRKIRVSMVYLVTNGKRVTEEFLKACRDWHIYTVSDLCDDKTVDHDKAASIIKWANEERSCGCHVALSLDRFHGSVKAENIYKLMTLPNLHLDKYNEGWSDTSWVLDVGRARTEGWGIREAERDMPWMFDERAKRIQLEAMKSSDGDDCLFVEQLYVTAEGYICKHCDYSYVQEKKMAMFRLPEKDTSPGAWTDKLCEFIGED